MTEELHQIGEVAKQLGLSLRTVRYYEEAGLVRPAERTNGGFRLYGDAEIARLELVKQMQPLGFSIKEMKQLLKVRDQLGRSKPGDPAHDRAHMRLAAFAANARQRVDDLRGQLERAELFASDLQKELRRRNHKSSAARS